MRSKQLLFASITNKIIFQSRSLQTRKKWRRRRRKSTTMCSHLV